MTSSGTIREQRRALAAALEPEPGAVWEVHVLHSLPASNPNRDRFQRPKEQTFGGARRARISSQSIKRATRERMHDELEGEIFGIRTRNVAPIIAKRITASGRVPETWDERTIAVIAAEATVDSSLKPHSGSQPADVEGAEETGDAEEAEEVGEAIVFVSEAELEHLADLILDHADAVELGARKGAVTAKLGKELKAALTEPLPAALRPIEAALTGRFFASRPDATIEAAVQVAHTLGIQPLMSETDFFSAVEERPISEHSGAAHTGDADFNASCHYKYARIDVPQIALNLDADEPLAQLDRARRTARAFLAAFIDAVPSAKQATMNASTPASFALIVRRRRGGWNLANAFVDALRSRSDLVGNGIARLDEHLGYVLDSTGDGDLIGIDLVNRTGADLSALAPVASGWQPRSHPGQLGTLLDRLAPRA
jgi:CRISPR system Cascade subunit CasC